MKKKSGLTPLHAAVKQGKLEAMRMLLKHGADVHSKNNVIEEEEINIYIYICL
jgi:ankyrin repeat protein